MVVEQFETIFFIGGCCLKAMANEEKCDHEIN